MVISVASFKGGVGKTTTAIHLAAFFQEQAPTLLLDGDQNRSSVAWGAHGKLPFKVVDEKQASMHVRNFSHIVVDTQARPEDNDMEVLAESCDLLVLPCTPDALAIRALEQTVEALRRLGKENYRVLLTIIPPRPNRDGEEARVYLTGRGLPLFEHGIRRLVAFQRAALGGVLVSDMDRENLGWADYAAVGDEVLGRGVGVPA